MTPLPPGSFSNVPPSQTSGGMSSAASSAYYLSGQDGSTLICTVQSSLLLISRPSTSHFFLCSLLPFLTNALLTPCRLMVNSPPAGISIVIGADDDKSLLEHGVESPPTSPSATNPPFSPSAKSRQSFINKVASRFTLHAVDNNHSDSALSRDQSHRTLSFQFI